MKITKYIAALSFLMLLPATVFKYSYVVSAQTNVTVDISGNGAFSNNTVAIGDDSPSPSPSTLGNSVTAENSAAPSPTATPIAFSTPEFPICIEMTPPGDQAHYGEGWHQIVAGELMFGSDDVYQLPNGNFIQCFCPAEGEEGIQTNWLEVGELDQATIEQYWANGWHLIGNGPDWGLPTQTYMAKNITYQCRGGATAAMASPTPTPAPIGGTSPTETPTPTLAPQSSGDTGGSSNNAGGQSEQKQGEILGIGGLPETGNFAAVAAGILQLAGLGVLGAGVSAHVFRRKTA